MASPRRRSIRGPALSRRLPPLLVLLQLLLQLAAAAGAADRSLEERLAELESLRARIARLQSELDLVRQRRAGLASELERIELELELQSTRVAEAESAVELLAGRLVAAEERVALLRRLEASTAEDLKTSLATLYQLGRGGLLRLALSIDTERDLLTGLRQMRYLARRQSAALERHLEARARLEVALEGMESQRARLSEWLAEQRRRRVRLVAIRQEQSRLLEAAGRRQRELTGETESLRQKADRLANLLDLLYGRSPSPLTGRSIEEFRGVLDWPAEGRVVRGFGPRRDPQYGTLVPHNGVDIATPPDGAVRAIYPGRVIFAAPFEGYGPMVVLSHAGRSFTLYAGLSRLAVGEGAVVSIGDELGRSDGEIYFEIRLRNEPQDPQHWLR